MVFICWKTMLFIFILSVLLDVNLIVTGAQCWKRKYYITLSGRAFNATIQCHEYYQWSVNEYCCYNDRSDSSYCCYSETYKLLIGVGLIFAMILSAALFLFLCWLYNLPHLLLKLLTCGKFSLNDYLKTAKLQAGPYVDPSFYSGEPFWTSEGSEYSHYPLRPMQPKNFYPVDLKRWSSQRHTGQTPLFIVASRQFTRNPYSARPNERGSSSLTQDGGSNSRRSSTSSCVYDNNSHRVVPPPSSFGFKVQIDEADATSELLEALNKLEDKAEKSFTISRVKEETDKKELLELESPTGRQNRKRQIDSRDREHIEIPLENSSIIVPVHNSQRPRLQPLDAAQLISQTEIQTLRTLSGTQFRRHYLKFGIGGGAGNNSSFDSTSTGVPFQLESISEEHHKNNTPHSANGIESYSNSNNLPGYIPETDSEDSESELNDRIRRQSINTA